MVKFCQALFSRQNDRLQESKSPGFAKIVRAVCIGASPNSPFHIQNYFQTDSILGVIKHRVMISGLITL